MEERYGTGGRGPEPVTLVLAPQRLDMTTWAKWFLDRRDCPSAAVIVPHAEDAPGTPAQRLAWVMARPSKSAGRREGSSEPSISYSEWSV